MADVVVEAQAGLDHCAGHPSNSYPRRKHLTPTLSRCGSRKNYIPSLACLIGLTPMQAGGSPMESVSVERLDHLGVVASVIKDFRLIERMDARLLLHG